MNYETFLDALADGEGHYLECPAGHGWLPPRRVCPACGTTELAAAPLPDAGRLVAVTEVQVPAPDFADDAPYCTAIAEFGPVRLTGQVRGAETPTVGDVVGVEAGRSATTDERVVVFRPR